MFRIFCECEHFPAGYPDPRDPYEEATARLAHPRCPVHAEEDAENGVDYDDHDMREQYALAYAHDLGEWVDEDRVDEETGDLLPDDPKSPEQ